MIPNAVRDSRELARRKSGETFKVNVEKVLWCKCFGRLTSILVFFYMKITDQDM